MIETIVIGTACFFAGMSFAAWVGSRMNAKERRRSVSTNPWE